MTQICPHRAKTRSLKLWKLQKTTVHPPSPEIWTLRQKTPESNLEIQYMVRTKRKKNRKKNSLAATGEKTNAREKKKAKIGG